MRHSLLITITVAAPGIGRLVSEEEEWPSIRSNDFHSYKHHPVVQHKEMLGSFCSKNSAVMLVIQCHQLKSHFEGGIKYRGWDVAKYR